jgi:hypothetical protein
MRAVNLKIFVYFVQVANHWSAIDHFTAQNVLFYEGIKLIYFPGFSGHEKQVYLSETICPAGMKQDINQM